MKNFLVKVLLFSIILSTLISCKTVPSKVSEEVSAFSQKQSENQKGGRRTDSLIIPKVNEHFATGFHGIPDFSEGGILPFCDFGGFESTLIGGSEKFEEWVEKRRPLQASEIENWICMTDYVNIYTFIKDFSITKEQFKNRKGPAESTDLIDKDIDILFSGTQEEIYAYFCNPYGLTKGEHFFPTKWLYVHSLEDYIKAGITSEMMESKLDKIRRDFSYPEGDLKDAIPYRIETIYNNLKKIEATNSKLEK